MQLCPQCSAIPFQALFGGSRKPRSHVTGSLRHHRSNNARCPFCRFLIEAYELLLSSTERPVENHKNVHLELYTEARSSGPLSDVEEPWFEKLGLTIDAATGPCLWLRITGTRCPSLQDERSKVCVSSIPAKSRSAAAAHGIVPRKRTQNESTLPRLDSREIKRWLSICNGTHIDCAKSTHFTRRVLNLRMIDVNRREIRLDCGGDYIALSYVWGSKSSFDSEAFWMGMPQDIEVLKLPDRLSQTIEDAITFTKDMGIGFLWVDALCINQAVDADRQHQIANMHLVYECALLTIAAMSGHSADAGLCGISKDFQKTNQPEVSVPYGHFLATYIQDQWSWHENWSPMPWETRAWTFQESLLSRRLILFTEYSIMWRCREEFFSCLLEASDKPTRLRSIQCDHFYWENGFSIELDHSHWSFLQYDSFLSSYTRRQLTKSGDILLACQGALNQITRNTGIAFRAGIPQHDLHLALLWKPHHKALLTRREGFPSWSWMGWQGWVEHHYCLDNLASYHEQGEAERRKYLARTKKVFGAHENWIMDNNEAVITIDDKHKTLRISSQTTCITVDKVREQGSKVKRPTSHSEQSNTAVGDHWVILKASGGSMPNTIGEVAQFEPIDYSFQTNPTISARIQQSDRCCELVFIKYFPYLGETTLRKARKWAFDYVGCLVLLRDQELNILERIGFVFLHLEDWAALDPKSSVCSVV